MALLTYLVILNFVSKLDKFYTEPKYWAKMLIFYMKSPPFCLHLKNQKNKFMSLYETQNKSYIQKISPLFPKQIIIAFRALI